MESWLIYSMTIIGMIILRIGIPLALTATIIYFLHRLDAKWHSEI